MKWFRGCPVLLLLLVTGILFSSISVRGEQGVYRNIPVSSGYEPACASMMKGIHDGIYPWSVWDAGPVREENGMGLIRTVDAMALSEAQFPDAGIVFGDEVSGTEHPSGNFAKGPDSLSGNRAEGTDSLSGNGMAGSDSLSGNEAKGNKASADESVSGANVPDGEKIPVSREEGAQTRETAGLQMDQQGELPAFQHVEEDYFDDALFIGDSRTVGLFEYGHLEDRAQFYAQTSLMIYEVMENPKAIVRADDGKGFLTIEEALSERQFGKIYIMLGLNEMGFGTPEYFGKAYGAVISRIRELQPDAVIYIQSIMHVAGEKDQTDPVYNNRNIDLRNQPLMQLADNQNVFYLDINEALCDESGCLISDWTFDQVHLKAAYYQVWKDFLLDHAIVR